MHRWVQKRCLAYHFKVFINGGAVFFFGNFAFTHLSQRTLQHALERECVFCCSEDGKVNRHPSNLLHDVSAGSLPLVIFRLWTVPLMYGEVSCWFSPSLTFYFVYLRCSYVRSIYNVFRNIISVSWNSCCIIIRCPPLSFVVDFKFCFVSYVYPPAHLSYLFQGTPVSVLCTWLCLSLVQMTLSEHIWIVLKQRGKRAFSSSISLWEVIGLTGLPPPIQCLLLSCLCGSFSPSLSFFQSFSPHSLMAFFNVYVLVSFLSLCVCIVVGFCFAVTGRFIYMSYM